LPPKADGSFRLQTPAKTSVRRKRLAGKYNFCVVRIIIVAIALLAGVASAETAVLECISSTYTAGKPAGTTFVQFRMTAVAGWKISKAALLFHITGATPPRRVEVGLVDAQWNEFDPSVTPVVGKTRKYDVTALKEGWIRIEIDPAQAQQIGYGLAVVIPGDASKKPFHLRDSLQFSPYLLLEGTRKD
jgi:hypothetical protein